MLSFLVSVDGRPVDKLDLTGAYVVGNDDVPLRAELTFRDGMIQCTKRAAGPAGLAIVWPIKDFGAVLTETVRLQERKQPYVLQVELVRGRLMRILQKIEDWGPIEFPDYPAILAQVHEARERLILALQADDPVQAARIADEGLSMAVTAGESLARLMAAGSPHRRRAGGGARRTIGAWVAPDAPASTSCPLVAAAFDFSVLPMTWRDIEPTEQTFNWKPIDAWVEGLSKVGLPIKGSSLLSFHESAVPDWLYIWEHDFDTIRDLAFEHIRRVINRYGHHITMWDAVCGIQMSNCFSFSFEQLMELTRMTVSLVRQMAPRSTVVIDLVAPWGEYYARNQRSIPPALFADMVLQSGLAFDAFGLRFQFGSADDGLFVRDLFQVSSVLDLYGRLGKPLHVTAAGVPSGGPVSTTGTGGSPREAAGGSWRKPWSQEVQADWLREFLGIALAKPFVESVAWTRLADDASFPEKSFGVLHPDGSAKAAYRELVRLRGVSPGTTGPRSRSV